MNRRWVTRTSRTVYENPWIEVSHREVTAPTGKHGIYGLVSFRNRAIGILPIDADGHTWLVGQHRYTLDSYSWEIPEGGAPLNESPLAAAQRELVEETGLVARRWTALLDLHTSNSVTDEVAHSFIAQDLLHGEAAPDDTELLELRRLPLADAVQMVLDGRITDALAMATLMKAQLLIDRGEIRI
ncbi:MAG: DNA mismatch repair protein MutT [Gammaproteobacteria bacterium]|nr:MAG: DNA mismatch repair protein MutT [Gammaproteobacteria bacterium]PIE35695.1 MAG: DNA mismatch repair protein MutT [Gammaproteobacteria bacterium]